MDTENGNVENSGSRGLLCPSSSDEIAVQFKVELSSLLKKYGAAIEAADHYTGYAECGEDIRMTVVVDGIWDGDGDAAREYTEIDLGELFPA